MVAVGSETPCVLIVDDNPLIVSVLESLLKSEDYLVEVSHDGKEALGVLEHKEIDVIVCDVMMPRMDGYALHEVIRSKPDFAHIPFIFLSALSDNVEVNRGLETGADDYLVKPFDPRGILSTIRGKVVRSRKLKEQRKEQLEAYQKRIVHTLSHEFRTPLVAINTGTELLIEQGNGLKEDKAKTLLEAVRRGGQRLERLVNDFMLLQQIEAGTAKKLYQQKGRIWRLSELVQYVYDFNLGDLKSAGFDFTFSIEEDFGIYLYGPHIHDLLNRLISNAVKFSRSHKVIEIRAFRESDMIVIDVGDRGIGLDPMKTRDAIELFGQIDRDKQEQQGSGIGLALADRYAKIHGGSLRFASRDGGGAVVSVVLPLCNEPLGVE